MKTDREVLVECRELWSWLAENPGEDKIDYFVAKGIKDLPYYLCPCCEKVKTVIDSLSGCKTHCPLFSYWAKSVDIDVIAADRDVMCENNENSSYKKWRRANLPPMNKKLKTKYAKLIVKACERRIVKIDKEKA